ncbi:hypothetical protein ABK040_014930 [Willaertia magna]
MKTINDYANELISSLDSSPTTTFSSSSLLSESYFFKIMDLNLEQFYYLVASDNNNTNHTIARVNYEQLPTGLLFALVSLISLLWFLLNLKGIFKSQISLQRRLFFALFCSCFLRAFQQLVCNQICFRNSVNFDEPICKTFSKLSQILDLIISAFNFIVYLILALFWAEMCITIKKTLDDEVKNRNPFMSSYEDKQYEQQGDEEERKIINAEIENNEQSDKSLIVNPIMLATKEAFSNHFQLVRKHIAIWFWVVVLVAFIFVLPFAVSIAVTHTSVFGYRTWAYQLSRLAIRLVFSLGTCLLLVIFGVNIYILNRKQMKHDPTVQTTKNIKQVAFVTIICTTAYFILSISNVITTIYWEWYSKFEHAYVFYICFSIVELFANTLLLIVLIPKPLALLLDKLFTCYKSNRTDPNIDKRTKLFYENTGSLDDDTFYDFYNNNTYNTYTETDNVSDVTAEDNDYSTRYQIVDPYKKL